MEFARGRIAFIRGGSYPHCHSVLIDDAIRAVIDASSSRERLLEFHAGRGIDVIITSHAHEDHFLYNSLFPDAQLWVHGADARAFTDLRHFIEIFQPGAEEAALWEGYLKDVVRYAPRTVNRELCDNDRLDFGVTSALVLHTPGHTPGHCSFHFPEERIMYLADWDLVSAGPYYGDPNSDLELTIASLERLMRYDVDTYLTAHGKGVHDGDPGIIAAYLDKIRQREDHLMELLEQGPKTLAEIAAQGIIYGKAKTIGIWDLGLSERNMMLKHLEKLMRQGLVASDGDRYRIVR
ncbi:MAG TPA: MBL fold metallo-hydrolase [Deltaproteobacteria bacterium]|nr:MBL fold metallo-hydrolase [Deltaproteobacteria bacterium]